MPTTPSKATQLNGLRACLRCGQADEVKVVDATFGRDLSGHVTSILDGVNGDDQTFGLDHLYRVETATAPAGYGSLTFQHDIGEFTKFLIKVPAQIRGSYTEWVKIVNQQGRTIRLYHDTFDQTGRFIHRGNKFPPPERHVP